MSRKIKKEKIKANSDSYIAYMTKVSDDYWYKIVSINSIESIFRIIKEYGEILIEENWNFTKEEDFDFWDGMRKEEIPKIIEAKYHILIHDDYMY